MALGLLFSRSSRTPSASLFPFEKVITIRRAAALKPEPALQIRRSQHTLTRGQAARAELLCSARASRVPARTGISAGLCHQSLFAILKRLVRRTKGCGFHPSCSILYFPAVILKRLWAERLIFTNLVQLCQSKAQVRESSTGYLCDSKDVFISLSVVFQFQLHFTVNKNSCGVRSFS